MTNDYLLLILQFVGLNAAYKMVIWPAIIYFSIQIVSKNAISYLFLAD
jgi:hypothetical protein